MKLRLPYCLAVSLFLSLSLDSLHADVWWQWSFGTESGFFLTDGEEADTAGAHTFTILDFSVANSGQGIKTGTLSGEEFEVFQPTQGFMWSGTGVTQFFRSSGTFTNGSNFFPVSSSHFYGFGPNEGGGAFDSVLREVAGVDIATSGPVTVTPLAEPLEARPDALIGKRQNPATHRGEDVHNTTGAGQTLTLRTRDRRKVKFHCSANTDAEVPEGLKLKGSKGNRYFRIKYFYRDDSGWTNVTGEVSGTGKETGRHNPGDTEVVRVEVKAKAGGRKRSKRIVFRARSQAVKTVNDKVKGIIKVRA